MYNNEVTYDKKWDTEENQRLRDETLEFLKPRAYCRCDIPTSWAKEVNWLINTLHKRYGIGYILSSYCGYTYPTSVLGLWVTNPLKALFYKTPKHLLKYSKKTKPQALLRNVKNFFNSFVYASKITKRNVTGYLYNKFYRPGIYISQVKEKFGYLTIYYTVAEDRPYLNDVVEGLIGLTTDNLADKGAYYEKRSK